MTDVTLRVSKRAVYDEVAKTTSYSGAKKVGEEGAYERIFTTDEDRLMLERFWVEACDGATANLKQFLVRVSDQSVGSGVKEDEDYEVLLSLPSRFDETLTPGIETSLFSYFVAFIVGEWYIFCNKEEAEGFVTMATAKMKSVMNNLYYRVKPTRVTPHD